ncbi:HipA domain-containing protein [uncultured Ruminococcus sp.]|uniref:HipA domain-containing protein n=1 Tax=uncultured Ruminococcus sp. TaxID=165186 RepID=UPI0025EEF2E9|nr:HipA domain-containing protein [uncultured Ruminococcus sp.]
MNYTLMHKNIRVADIEIDEDTGVIIRIGDIYDKEHLPAGVPFCHNETIDRAALNKWWTGRSIPASRIGINEALETLGVYNTELLLTKCLGLSLSDHYWVRPADSDMTWESVNFFDNESSDDIGDVLFGSAGKSIGFNYSSPDNTSDGNLQKRWKIIDGKRCLLKSGSAPFRQQPINEVIASIILERLGIDHIPYTLMWIDDKPYSVCENFVSKNTELIGAARLMKIRPKANDENSYLHFVNICSELGVNIVPMLDRMIVFDYIIANEDRHFGNFGLLRDPDTLEWTGAAPIFDNGTSLWYDKLTSQIPETDIICKPFKNTHGEQLRMVSSFDWLDISKLDGLEDEIYEILSDEKVKKYIDAERADMLVSQIRKRIDRLSEVVMVQNSSQDISSINDDIKEDEAASYGITIK